MRFSTIAASILAMAGSSLESNLVEIRAPRRASFQRRGYHPQPAAASKYTPHQGAREKTRRVVQNTCKVCAKFKSIPNYKCNRCVESLVKNAVIYGTSHPEMFK